MRGTALLTPPRVRSVALLLLAALVMSPWGEAHAAASGPRVLRGHRHGVNQNDGVSVSSHGLTLTLSLPRTTYPRNALVLVHISLRNKSGHRITVLNRPGLSAQVLPSANSLGYDPDYPFYPTGFAFPGGPLPVPVPLGRGKTMKSSLYLVLRDSRIQASASIGKPGPGKEWTVQTPPLVLHLTSEPQPVVHIVSSPTPRLLIEPAWQVNGPALSTEELFCWTSTGAPAFGATSRGGWYPVPNGTIDLSMDGETCSGKAEWHLLVGWRNHPVAYVDYVRPAPTPSPAPSTLLHPSQSQAL